MPKHRVDLDRLADIVDQMGRFEACLESALAEIDGRVDRMHMTWTGDAAAAHRRAHEEWIRGVAEMRAGFATMRRNARIAHENYRNAIEANGGMWAQAL